jgi:hypothetical protein
VATVTAPGLCSESDDLAQGWGAVEADADAEADAEAVVEELELELEPQALTSNAVTTARHSG